jgi:magnesium chelatase family protein
MSGPILDRIDICVNVEQIEHSQLLSTIPDRDDMTSTMALVLSARERQAARFGNRTTLNSSMSNTDIRRFCTIMASAKQTLDNAAGNIGLSARGYMRCLKVARTIADLEGSDHIGKQHVTEALRYRSQTVLAS